MDALQDGGELWVGGMEATGDPLKHSGKPNSVPGVLRWEASGCAMASDDALLHAPNATPQVAQRATAPGWD